MHGTRIYQELRAIGFAGFTIILLASVYFWLFPASNIHPVSYFFLSSSIWFFSMWQTWKRAELNRPSNNTAPYLDLGWANGLTLVRAGLISLTGGFLLQAEPAGIFLWLPGLFYGLAALLDRVDGFVARRTGRTSLLGSELDTVFDALGLLVAPLVAIQFGKLHWSFLAVSLAYYVFMFGLYWRQYHQRPTYPLLPSQLRRAFAGFQMGVVALIMLPVFSANITELLGVAFMLPILMGFVVDWLVVSGRIDGTHPNSQAVILRIELLGKNLLQPALRFTTGLLIFSLLFFNTRLFDAFAFGINLSSAMQISLTILAILIIFGMAARIAALALIIALCYLFREQTIFWYQGLLLFATSWLLLLGPGNYCLWRGDDLWINRQEDTQ